MRHPFADNPLLSPEQTNGDFLDLEDALYNLQFHSPGNSQVVKDFGKAGIELLHDPERPQFREVCVQFAQDRPDLLAPHKAQLLWRGFQYFWMQNLEAYPHTFNSQPALEAGIQSVLEKQSDRELLQIEILGQRWNQTNEPRRYAGPKLAIGLYKHLLPEPFSLVDAGCSVGLGQVQMQTGQSFSHVEVRPSEEEFNPDEEAPIIKYIKDKIAGRLALSRNVGFDRDVNTDITWVEACSYYPNELINGDKRRSRQALYKKLKNIQDSERDLPYVERRFQLVWGDIVNAQGGDLDEVRALAPDGTYDVAMAVTSLYEVPATQTREALAGLESLAGRLAIVQDFAEIDPGDPASLVFAEDIYGDAARYNLFAKPTVEPGEPWHHLGTWNTGRARIFTPSPLIGDLYHDEQVRAN